jgi:hypothetical protein
VRGSELFVAEKNTTNMTLPGSTQSVPVTSNPEWGFKIRDLALNDSGGELQ